MESSMGHESSNSNSLLDHHGGHNPPTGAGSLGNGLSAGQPMMLRTVSRKGTARGSGSSDTNSLGGGSGSGLEVAAAGARRRHKSDSAALFTHQVST
jgi:hypothetical protein